jgi:hypothetical protein
MDIWAILNLIGDLSMAYPDEVIVEKQTYDRKRIYKYLGKFFSPIDEGILQSILQFNRMSLLGFTTMGIGDTGLSPDFNRFSQNNWTINHGLVPYYLGFGTTRKNEIVGSLTNYKGGKQFPVGCLGKIEANEFTIIGSSYIEFLKNLVLLVEETLNTGQHHLPSDIFQDQEYWLRKDEVLRDNTASGMYLTSIEDNWKLEFKFLEK